MAQPNFGLLNTNLPAEIAGSVQRGQDEALRSQMAQQQFKTAGLQQESAQMQLEQAKRERDALAKMQQSFVANGKSPDMRANFQEMVQSGIPHFMDIGFKGMQALDRQANVAKILGGGMSTEVPAAAPSMMRQAAASAPTENALGTGMYGMEPTAPANALAARPSGAYAPVMPRNALAAPVTNDIENTYRKIDQLHAIGEHELAKSLEQRAKDKLPPTAVQEYKFAQTPEGGNYRGSFEAFKVLHAPKTTVNVPVNVSTEKKYGEQFASKMADTDIAKMTTAERAPELAANADRVLDILKQGNVFTGSAADIKLNVARALNVVGASNDDKIANTEGLISGLAKNTLGAVKSSGLGSGQGFTDKDLAFLQDAEGGRITLNAQTLQRLAGLSRKAAEGSAAAWNSRVQQMPKSAIEGTGLSTQPISVPKRTEMPAAIYATNPKTGERIQSTDGGNTWKSVGAR